MATICYVLDQQNQHLTHASVHVTLHSSHLTLPLTLIESSLESEISSLLPTSSNHTNAISSLYKPITFGCESCQHFGLVPERYTNKMLMMCQS